ncbi:MAG: ComEC/Rec2 family competence protein, partial [Bacteroidaceae bacterium]|nr:ComEC/Rec2 family competence protein [Bacteroidaceae bacterium]
FLPAAVAAVVAQTILRHNVRASVLACIVFWLLLGAGRMSLHRLRPPLAPTPFATLCNNISANAREHARMLVVRLHKRGLNEEPLALTAAMLLGQRTGLDVATRKAFSISGTSHLLALSGMHLGVVYGMLYVLFLFWVRHTRWRWHALPFMLLCIWGYALLTGLPVSLVRASLMLTFMLVGSMAERGVPSLHILSMAALAILFCTPEAIHDIGFQLSFLSVFFILTLYLPLQRCYHRLFTGWGLILRPMGVSLAAQIGTAPLCIYYFHTLPLGGVIINLLLVPLTTGIIYLGVAALLFPATAIVGALDWMVRSELWLVDAWSRIPHIALQDIYFNAWMVALLYALLLCALVRLHLRISEDDFDLPPVEQRQSAVRRLLKRMLISTDSTDKTDNLDTINPVNISSQRHQTSI